MKTIVKFIFCLIFTLNIAGCSTRDLWQEQYVLGVRYLNEGNYAEAIVAFTAAIDIDEKNVAAYLGRAQAYLKIGNEENITYAVYDFEKVIEIDGTIVEAYSGLADAYISINDFDKALETLKNAEGKVDNSSYDLYENKSITLYSADEQIVINLKHIDSYLYAGWYTEPVCVMYSVNGESQVILESEVEVHKSNGWYTEPVKAESETLPKLCLKASAFDNEILSFANENYATLAVIQGYVSMGAYFHVNYDVSVSDSNSPNGMGLWWLVDDERVSNMEELKSFWYSHFSQSSDKTIYTEMYKEFDGKLYSACPGVGGSDAGKPNYTNINKISSNRIEITGTIAHYDEYGEYWNTRNSTIVMVLEDDMWMCERVR